MSSEYVKGTIRTIILKVLSENERLYGYEISQLVEEMSGNEIKLKYGALYPVLYKLENEGLLTTTTEVVDNRVRKYYALTDEGRKLAKVKISELQRFTETLKKVLTPSPNTKLGLEISGI